MVAAIAWCNFECEGYSDDPRPGDLWPGESEKEFGYPVTSDATKEAE